jgi:hypothetical protein
MDGSELEEAEKHIGVGSVVLASRRHLRATPEVNQRNHQVAQGGERLVRMCTTRGAVILAKDGIADPEQALYAPVCLPELQQLLRTGLVGRSALQLGLGVAVVHVDLALGFGLWQRAEVASGQT